MKAKRDYYEVLGVSRQDDEKAIKKAYRSLAKKYHPDANTGNADAEQKFKEITEAYDVLGDSEKKKLYDQFGHAAFDDSFAGAGSPGGNGYTDFNHTRDFSGFNFNSGDFNGKKGSYRQYHFEGENMEDIFGDLFGDRSFHSKGSDLNGSVGVTFDEAAFGCDKMIQLQGADGRIQTLQVHIPAGIDSGKSVRLKGKGNPGIGGGASGDLFLKVMVGTKPGFERQGEDVYTTVEIPFTTAVFGGEARVKTLHGDVVCKIPEGTQSGSKIRLKGKGIVSMKNPKVYGDQYVSIQIQVPKNLSTNAKAKLREYEQALQSGQSQRAG